MRPTTCQLIEILPSYSSHIYQKENMQLRIELILIGEHVLVKVIV